MRKFLFMAIMLLAAGNSFAQCNMVIFPSPGHIKITSNQTIAATGTVYWICDGIDVVVSSSPGSIFLLEANATITFNGSNGDEVYAKSGCIITNNTVEDIGVTVNPSNVTMNNNGGGSITVTMSCTNVTYDYSMVGGSSGCMTEISEVESQEITIYPNPVNDKINFTKSFTGEYSIYDVSGNLVCRKNANQVSSITVETLPAGAYALFLNNKAHRFIK